MQHSLSRQIIIPLSVMVLLTVIIGFSMLQLIRPWEKAVENVNQHFAEAVILNQIRTDLTVIEQGLEEKTLANEMLVLRWEKLSEKVAVFNQMAPDNNLVLPSFAPDSEPSTQFYDAVNALLKRDFFRHKLQQTQAEMSDLLEYTRFVTMMVTLSMVVLGGVLMGLTANRLNKLINQLSQSRDLNMRIQEEERRRIAQDLHDSVVQDMVDLKREYQPEKADALIDNVRRICHNLKPQVLHDLGLVSALEFLVEDLETVSGIESVHLDASELHQVENLSKDIELSVFRVVQESFANIRRHSGATEVWADFDIEIGNGTFLLCEIKDNGKGFNSSAQNGSQTMGLTGMRERIEQLGGRYAIQGTEAGTVIRFSVPIDVN